MLVVLCFLSNQGRLKSSALPSVPVGFAPFIVMLARCLQEHSLVVNVRQAPRDLQSIDCFGVSLVSIMLLDITSKCSCIENRCDDDRAGCTEEKYPFKEIEEYSALMR